MSPVTDTTLLGFLILLIVKLIDVAAAIYEVTARVSVS